MLNQGGESPDLSGLGRIFFNKKKISPLNVSYTNPHF